MAAKSRRTAPVPGDLQRAWDKYGTWVVTALAAALIVALVVVLVQRHRESRRQDFYRRLAVVDARLMFLDMRLRQRLMILGPESMEPIKPVAAEAEQMLRQLLVDCDDEQVRPHIELSLAQALLKQENYSEAETVFAGLTENASLSVAERALVNLGLAYTAEALDRLDEARQRWERVRDDGLYPIEALQHINLIDTVLTRKAKQAAAGTRPGIPVETE